jgi:hypothetical protein
MSSVKHTVSKRFGIEFYDTGRSVTIESGSRPIGYTDYDSKRGTQVFWFKNEEEWNEHRRDVFDQQYPFQRPIPVFDAVIVETEVPNPVAEETTEGDGISEEEAFALDFQVGKLLAAEGKACPDGASDATKAGYCSYTPPIENVRPTLEDIVTAHNSTPTKKRFSDVAKLLGVESEIVQQVILDNPSGNVTIHSGGWLSVA